MPRNITVTFEDGSQHVYQNAPDEITPDMVQARAQKDFGKTVKALDGGRGASAAAEPSMLDKIKQSAGDAVGGLIRGAAGIGNTLLSSPADLREQFTGASPSLTTLVTGQKPQTAMDRRAQGYDSALTELVGSNPDSLLYKGGKLTSEIAGTAGVGGALANGLRSIPVIAKAAPELLNAIGSAGMTTGAPAATGLRALAGNAATRVAGGAITGGTSAALVDPSSAGTGALIGGALPPVIAGLGAAGGAAANAWRKMRAGGDVAGAEALVNALGAATPTERAALVAKLRNAETLVPGSPPTVAQALLTPESAVLEKVIHDSPGGATLANVLKVQQPAARLAALEGVAPTVATGRADAMNSTGNAIRDFAMKGDQAARGKTRALYESVPQDEAALYLPDLSAVRDKYFGRGAFVDRGAADKAVATAQDIGTEAMPAIQSAKVIEPQDLANAVRKAGGISGRTGELRDLGIRESGTTGLVNNKSGKAADMMADEMYRRGFIKSNDPDDLLRALGDAVSKRGGGMGNDVADSAMRGQYEAAMGDAPMASSVPKKVTLREFDNLRSSIGSEQRAAKLAGNDKLSTALSEMRDTLDKRINEVVAGDGAVDENLPIAWADALDAARKAKVDQVQRFRTGPQAGIFRTGPNGDAALQGGEVAQKFWGARPGLSDDVKSFRRLIDDNPAMLGQFKSMVTTEGAGTANAAGDLTTKFSKWVGQTLPGLREAFSPAEVKTLQRIAADIDRQATVTGLGAARAGSDTMQKATNALSLGLLDSPALGRAATMIPGVKYVSGPGLDALRGVARNSKAKSLAGVMADSNTAADAIERLSASGASPQQVNALARIMGLSAARALPVAGSR